MMPMPRSIKTNRRAGTKGQHRSLLQNKRLIYEGEEIATEKETIVRKITEHNKYWDADYLLKDRKKRVLLWMWSAGLPVPLYEDRMSAERNKDLIQDVFDHIPGAYAAASALCEIADFIRNRESEAHERAYANLLNLTTCIEHLSVATFEPYYHAEKNRGTSKAVEAKKARGISTKQIITEERAKLEKGPKMSKSHMMKIIAHRCGLGLSTVDKYFYPRKKIKKK
jgi:S-adenosylmethionine:tRNA-ribosyltransferase-isomerase (queuine synthetase)